MVFSNRSILTFLVGLMAIASMILVATESADAHDGTYRIEWMWQGEDLTSPSEPVAPPGAVRPRRSFNPYETTSIEITLELKNYGDGGDNVSFSSYSQDLRVFVSIVPQYTYMQADQTKFIKVIIDVLEDLHPGVYNLFVNASSEDTGTATRVVALDFEVENYDAKVPTIPTFVDPVAGDVVRSELVLPRGGNFNFKLKVENNGTRPLPGVMVRVFDAQKSGPITTRWNIFNFTTPPIAVGDRFIVGEPPFRADNPPITWWSNVSGNHVLEFRVMYEHQSETDNDYSSVNIRVTRPPEITDVEPATGETFKDGDTITLRANATDADGDDLTYTWMEGDTVLGIGQELNISGLPPGEHTITLIVDDGTSSTSQEFTITIEKKEKSDGPGFGAALAILALTSAIVLFLRRR